MKYFHLGMSFGKFFDCLGMMNGSIVENQRQCFSCRMCTKLVKKCPKGRVSTFSRTLPVKTIVSRSVCPKYRAALAFRRRREGKKVVLACSTLEPHKDRWRNDFHPKTSRQHLRYSEVRQFQRQFSAHGGASPLCSAHVSVLSSSPAWR